MPRSITKIERLAQIIGLLLIGLPASQAQQINWQLTDEAVANSYATYQVTDDATTHPGIGMRYRLEQDWFLFGEAHHANHVSKTQEPRLFHPDEPRTILIGGGIYF